MFGTLCLVATACSPSAWFGASLSISFCGLCPRSSRRWGRSLLGWPLGSHCNCFLGGLVGQILSTSPSAGCCLSLVGFTQCFWATSCFDLQPCISSPRVWPSQCVDICRSLGVAFPRSFGVCAGSSQCPLLVSCMRLSSHGRVSPSEVVHSSVESSFLSVNEGLDHVVHGRSTLPSQGRLRGLARWVMMPWWSVFESWTSVSNGVGSLFPWMLLLSGVATLGCSTLSQLCCHCCRAHLICRAIHCCRSSALPCQGLPSILLFFPLPLWSFWALCSEDLMCR